MPELVLNPDKYQLSFRYKSSVLRVRTPESSDEALTIDVTIFLSALWFNKTKQENNLKE